MKEEFLKVYKKHIHRNGADKLLAWMEKQDFFAAPASTRYHGAHESGLCEHSLNVHKQLAWDNEESRAIVALLHDICKTNFYIVQMRNVKENGAWVQRPFYAVDDQVPYGHGEKSVFMIERFMRLTTEEAMAIRWHMGDYSQQGQSAAFEKYPLALLLHQADERATYLDEVREDVH